MTAIFMVWNSTGLAIASDRSASATETDEAGNVRVLFNEYESKIFKPSNRNFAAASAGSAAINGVPIQGILHQWNKTCEQKATLFDYAESFVQWFASTSLLETAHNGQDVTSNYVAACLEFVFERLAEVEQDLNSYINTINQIFTEWEENNPPNIYGNAVEKKGVEFRQNNSIQADIPLYHSFVKRFENFRLPDSVYEGYEEDLSRIFDAEFKESQQVDFDPEDPWNSLLKQRLMQFVPNYVNGKWEYADILFAGYGENDWLPSAVKIRIYDFDQMIPWVVITKVTDIDSVWYQYLGQNETVSRFWDPISSVVRNEITEVLNVKFGNRNYLEKVLTEIDTVISSHDGDLLNPIRKKIKLLSVDKLAFIAQQMVSLESFNSFIHEYLPTVGGDIDIVKLTRVDGEHRL